MKRAYIGLLRAMRHALATLGLLGLLDRLARRNRMALWVRSWFAIYDLHDLASLDLPWWTMEAAGRVDAFLAGRTDARVLEWGSGASTLWLAGRAAEVIAIEHDPAWGAEVAAMAPHHVRVLVEEPQASDSPEIGSKKTGFSDLDFSGYVRRITDLEGEFDLIVIDGRARESCLEHAAARLAPGGVVVFDNVDRERYRRAIAQVREFDVEITRGLTPCLPYPTRTALLTRRRG